jgi:eukaryotic-like serine/threonine-protein kinase
VARLIYMHVGAPIPRATEIAPELPPAVDDVLTRMLGKLPEERFPTLSDALAALTIALEPPPAAASPAMPAPAPRPPAPLVPVAPPQHAAGPMVVTASGTLVVPQLPPSAALATKRGGLSRKHVEVLILLCAATVSVIGLVVIAFVVLRQVDTAPSPDPSASPPGAAPGAPATEAPPNLAPTSHDNGRMKVKGPARPRHGGN